MAPKTGVAEISATLAARVSTFSWEIAVTGNQVSLTYGVEGTDSVGLGMQCQRGSGRVRFGYRLDEQADTHAYGAQWGAKITLASGSLARRYIAHGEASELGPYVTAETSSRDPALVAFGRSGRISIDGWRQDASGAAELRHIREFLARCGLAKH
jgi:hypothetical protein